MRHSRASRLSSSCNLVIMSTSSHEVPGELFFLNRVTIFEKPKDDAAFVSERSKTHG